MASPISNRIVRVASVAFKKILSAVSPNRPQQRERFTVDPATGALIISPELDLIICKTLRREARRIAFRLRLRQPLFEINYLALKVRYTSLRLLGNLSRRFPKFIFYRHKARS